MSAPISPPPTRKSSAIWCLLWEFCISRKSRTVMGAANAGSTLKDAVCSGTVGIRSISSQIPLQSLVARGTFRDSQSRRYHALSSIRLNAPEGTLSQQSRAHLRYKEADKTRNRGCQLTRSPRLFGATRRGYRNLCRCTKATRLLHFRMLKHTNN